VTSRIDAYGGLAVKLPRVSSFFVISSLALIGLPVLNSFVGEFLILSSAFTQIRRGWAVAATFGTILSAGYMLWLVQRLFYGQPGALAARTQARDLRFHELAAITPLAVLMLAMGVAPMLWMKAIAPVHPPSQN